MTETDLIHQGWREWQHKPQWRLRQLQTRRYLWAPFRLANRETIQGING